MQKLNSQVINYEPFIQAQDVIDSGLFPRLTKDTLKHYVRQGIIRAYGPAKSKTYLLSEVYEDWKKIGRRVDNYFKVPIEGSKHLGNGRRLNKAWKKVT